MRKTWIITIAACSLMAYVFWNSETISHNDEEVEHTHRLEDEQVVISNDQIQVHDIQLRQASSGTLEYTIRAPAKIVMDPDRIAHIFPNVSGTLLHANKNLGDSVGEGETLAILSSKEITEAKAAYLSAYNKHALNRGVFQREQGLYDKKITPIEHYYQAENDLNVSLIELELSRQKLLALGLNAQEITSLQSDSSQLMGTYEIRSPISGTIIARDLTPGEIIRLDHEVYIVADLTSVWVEINIFPQDRRYVKENQQVTISTIDGPVSKTLIHHLSPIIDEDTHTSRAISTLDNRAGKWLPGTYVNAELITHTVNVPIVVPKEAIQNVDGSDILFVPSVEGFSARPIEIGRSDFQHCEVISGLTHGESYACKNTFLLKAELKKDEAEHMD